ncbi:hypothetical protein M407DRAFT_27068 [Tulasnella calospora MUT 4182]|uniref:Uncharacterized protein n=1 Tax=Tulasnella calospora MUT 4182 TaxID=1051891 RepID=A0A0C3LPX3_9AGAM|nr:hypothetical protein M407DRAFT_27068 [Tulasnella calospora MUT 4182]
MGQISNRRNRTGGTTLKANSPVGAWVGYQIIEGICFGILYAEPQFPVLAPVKITESAHALALFVFKKLPEAFSELFHGEGVEITYAAISKIGGLAEPLKTGVRDAFAGSLRTMWFVRLAISLLGFVTVFGMKQLEMHEETDENWGLEEKKKVVDEEKDGMTLTV